MKWLLLRFSSIGDIVLTTPVVRCLRKRFPDAQIHFATKKDYRDILKHNPYLDKLHLLGDSLEDLVQELKREQFEFILDLHHNQRTFWLKQRLGVPSSSFDKVNWQKWLMVHAQINRLPKLHIVDRYMATTAVWQVANDGEGLDYFITEEERVPKTDLPSDFGGQYMAWVIGAKFNTKKFPTEKIIRVLKQVSMPVVLLGGKEDEQSGERIVHEAAGAPVYSACGKYSLNQSASLVEQAKAVVTNDTGLMHIAAAFRKPIISLWGNTIPEFGMYPYYGSRQNSIPHYIFEIKGLDCRPCSKLGYSACPKGHFNCMNQINETLLAAKMEEFWSGA